MAKRVTWKHNGVVSLKLRDDVYTLGQMLGRATMRFFNVWKSDGNWNNLDLTKADPLFTLYIGNVVLHNLVDKKLSEREVSPDVNSCTPYWIKPHLNFEGGYPFKGGDLIDVGTEGNIGTTQARILKENLSIDVDQDIIEKYELTNMWGDEDLRERLLYVFETGRDRDYLKEKVFPGYNSDRESA